MKTFSCLFLIVTCIFLSQTSIWATDTDDSAITLTRAERFAIYQEAQEIAAENGNSFEVSKDAIPKYKYPNGLKLLSAEGKGDLLNKINSAGVIKAMLPKWDWRDHEGVTKVKNQGDCGSCWAFAATGNFEHSIKTFDSKETDLSEQDLMNCNKQGYGCDGGCLDCSEYFRDSGAAMESDEPYKAQKGSCNSGLSRQYKIKEYANFEEDAEMMKSCIYYYGSIVTVCDAGSAFRAYSRGVYNVKGGTPNHAILAIGWDDPAGYWIIKNSWGEEWGEKGYGKIKYGSACVGQENTVIDYKGKQLDH
ncbi:MAG: C1 family peptidase [Candidatus Wallbacteria bacterium]|nr:C1 family peptidase [Candidatus Wallbacteria bacterium]